MDAGNNNALYVGSRQAQRRGKSPGKKPKRKSGTCFKCDKPSHWKAVSKQADDKSETTKVTTKVRREQRLTARDTETRKRTGY